MLDPRQASSLSHFFSKKRESDFLPRIGPEMSPKSGAVIRNGRSVFSLPKSIIISPVLDGKKICGIDEEVRDGVRGKIISKKFEKTRNDDLSCELSFKF